MSSRKPSPAQALLLQAVSEGRVEYGVAYPDMARRRPGIARNTVFLIDGHPPYARQHQTWAAINDRGWVDVRYDLVETHRVPARAGRQNTLAGPGRAYAIPACARPVDPGWRTPVELTDAGRAALASSGPS